MKVQTLVLWFAVMLIGTVSFAEETEPSAIFKKVTAAYESMETYSSEGTIIADIETGGVKRNRETSFSIKLKKPNLYLISWDQKNAMMPNLTQTGAVWNDGSQPYLFMGILKAYSKMSSDEMTLGSATCTSGGAAITIPSLFLSVLKQPAPFSRLVDPKLEGNEQVEGEDCYVISGSSTIYKKETFWISKETSMIRQYSRFLETPEGGRDMPKMTDQQLEEPIKAMGQEVTEETKEAMRKMMKQAEDAMFKQPAPFFRLVDPKLEGNQQVEGEDCYVISGSSAICKKETFWISKKTSMIRKYSYSLGMSEGGRNMPKMTDQQLEETIKAMGQEVTKESREAMRKMMKQAEDMMQTDKMKGTTTELHSKIATPKLIEGDFAFKVPVDTALKESLFGEVLNAK